MKAHPRLKIVKNDMIRIETIIAQINRYKVVGVIRATGGNSYLCLRPID